MKKWLALVLLGAFLVTAMSGCKKDTDEEEEKTEEPAE